MNGRMKSTRRRATVVALVAIAAVGGGAAHAAFPETDVTTYTGCVGLGGNAGGLISQVTEGANPLKPCTSNQKLVHLSGGDITEVKVQDGLTGGGTNGALTIGLSSAQSLPQNCPSGKVPKADGNSAWVCADDNDHQYLPGDGLSQSGNVFSVRPNYRLPQGCNFGQVPQQRNGFWGCGNLERPALTQRVVGFANTPQGSWTHVARMTLPSGFHLFTASGLAIDDSVNGNDEVSIECKLYQDSTEWAGTWVDIGDQSSDLGPAAPITITTVIGNFNGATVVDLSCMSHTGSDHLSNVRLTALPIGNLSNG